MRRCPDTPLRWSLFRCRKFPRWHPERSGAACQSFAQVRLHIRLEPRSESPTWTTPYRCHPPCRPLSLFHRYQRRQSRFSLLVISFRSPVPQEVGLLLILGGSSFFTQQAVLIFDNERTITKGIAINS